MTDSSDAANKNSCRICLSSKKTLCPLFRYKLSGNYAEMLTAIADVKVAVNDGLPEKICTKCCTTLEKAYLLKTVAERSDRKLRKLLAKGKLNVHTKKIAFDSFTDVKSEIPFSIKPEPKWEMEIDLDNVKQNEAVDGQDLVIANTVIRKVDPNVDDVKVNESTDTVDLTWTKTSVNKNPESDVEYIDDPYQDDDDDDYVPPVKEKPPKKLKRTRQVESTTYKGRPIVRKIKVLRKIKDDFDPQDGKKATTITCFPILKNGSRGAPILLKRPKDSTILKVQPCAYNQGMYKIRGDGSRVIKREKPMPRVVRAAAPKQREKLVCPVCGILTYTLGNHMTTHEEKKKYTCSQCPKTFTQKSNLLVHAKQHTGVKDHICEICGAGFYSQKSLVRHNLIHKGERPYPCNLCSKRFIAVSMPRQHHNLINCSDIMIPARCDLNRHLRIHSGYKPFKCDTCTMSFNAKHQLQNHERMHTGERPYTCQMTSLRVHMRTHTGEKLFECDICYKKFTQSHHLRNHKLVHTGDKPFHCEVCNVAFSYKVNLNNHVFKVHGINLKFKSIHTVTEDILRREMGMLTETRAAIAHIMPQLGDVPPPAAHETVPHSDY